jgi:putative ABC transport system ATP-binding protein
MSLDSIRATMLATDPLRGVRAPHRNSCMACQADALLAAERRRDRSADARKTPTSKGTETMNKDVTTLLADTTGPVIRTASVTKRYTLGKANEVVALRGASVEIDRGEMVAIVGPSGSGKSTMMHIIGCLDAPDSGRLFINGRRVDRLSARELTKVRSAEIGFIFQGFNLIPTMNALDNVALAAEYAGTPRREALERAQSLLDLVGLGSRSRHLPSELSGG